jgi:ABC-type polysaccharide transport system permease subunit
MISLASQGSSKPRPVGMAPTAQRASPLARLVRNIRKNGTLFLMALLFVFQYMPLPGIVIAFKNYRISQDRCRSPEAD